MLQRKERRGRMKAIMCKVKVQGEEGTCGEFYFSPNLMHRSFSLTYS
jgi:hypothetical protein